MSNAAKFATPGAGDSRKLYQYDESGDAWALALPAPTTETNNGEVTFDRLFAIASTSLVSGQMRLSYFTARKTETINNLVAVTGTTAAAATPTLCRMGIYSIATNGDGTLVASTANDTTLFASISTVYTKATQAGWSKTAGVRYAFAILVVSGTTMPNMPCQANSSLMAAELGVEPRVTAAMGSQTDLPASFVSGSLAVVGPAIYGRMTT